MQQLAPQTPVVLTAKEAADFLKLSYFTIQQLASENRIPCRKLGRQWRFLQSELTDWLVGNYDAVRHSNNTDNKLVTIAPILRTARRKKDASSEVDDLIAKIRAETKGRKAA